MSDTRRINTWLVKAINQLANTSEALDLKQELSSLLKSANGFWQQIQVHHLSPILYELLQNDTLPKTEFPGLYRQANRLRRFHIQRSLKIVQEIKKVCTALEENGIPAAVYKGVALSVQYYDDVSRRTTRDIDLAIPLAYYPRCEELMTDMGYVLAKPESSTKKQSIRNKYLDYPWNMLDAEGEIISNVDIHWKPSHHALYSPYIFSEAVLKRRVHVHDTWKIPSLAPIDHALSVIIHHGVVDGWAKLYQLLDLMKIFEHLNLDQREELYEACRANACFNSLKLGLSLVQELFSVDIANLGFKKNEKRVSGYVDSILEGTLAENWNSSSQKLWAFLRTRDSGADKFRSAIRLMHFYILR